VPRLPSHSAPRGAPGAAISITLKVPPDLPAAGGVTTGAEVVVGLAVVTAGTVGWALVAAAVVVAAGLVVITAGVVVADVVVVVVAVPHPVTIKAMTNRTASAMNNLFTSYFLHY
jgi:hypothetical protein